MEPQFEEKPLVKFEANQHHIFKVEDVMFALEAMREEPERGVVSDYEYIAWIYDVFKSRDFGFNALYRDMQNLEYILKNSSNMQLKHQATMSEIVQEMRQEYETRTSETVNELNSFLARNKGLVLWSTDPQDTIDKLTVDEQSDHGKMCPMLKSGVVYINIDWLNETDRSVAMRALPAVQYNNV